MLLKCNKRHPRALALVITLSVASPLVIAESPMDDPAVELSPADRADILRCRGLYTLPEQEACLGVLEEIAKRELAIARTRKAQRQLDSGSGVASVNALDIPVPTGMSSGGNGRIEVQFAYRGGQFRAAMGDLLANGWRLTGITRAGVTLTNTSGEQIALSYGGGVQTTTDDVAVRTPTPMAGESN